MLKRWYHRILSNACAAALLLNSLLPALPAAADNEAAAHTVNVFGITIKSGADYYTNYSGIDDPNVYVWKADQPNEGHKFVYNIKFSISGEGTADDETSTSAEKEATSNGFIEIRIPKHILKDASGAFSDEAELPVPHIDQLETKVVNGKTVYTTDHQFVYKEEEQYYVIYNIQSVSSGIVYEFPIAYATTEKTWDYTDLESMGDCFATLNVKSWQKNQSPDEEERRLTIEERTNNVSVYIDTSAELTSTSKKAESYKTKERGTQVMLTAEEAKAATGLTTLDENYRYVIWSVSSNISTVTQKYGLSLTDTMGVLSGTDAKGMLHTAAGTAVAVKFSGGTGYQPIGSAGISDQTASGRRTDYVLTRFPADAIAEMEDAPRTGSYTCQNAADVTLTPADGKDTPTAKNAVATLKYELRRPVWEPIGERYSENKYGLYNNGANRVTSKNNVSSFDLEPLAEGTPISGLRYESVTTAHAYGKTIDSLNSEISQMLVQHSEGSSEWTITLGERVYTFDKNDRLHYTLTINNGTPEQMTVDQTVFDGEYDDLMMEQIAAYDLAQNYYGKKPLSYCFEDKTLELAPISTVSETTIGADHPLTGDDYRIDAVGFEYHFCGVEYDPEEMEFSEAPKDTLPATEDLAAETLEFYALCNGTDEAVKVAAYNLRSETSEIFEPEIVTSMTDKEITFAADANVTGYQVRTQNKYFIAELMTRPSITLLGSDNVKQIARGCMEGETEKKLALRNTANWEIRHKDGTVLHSADIRAFDYIAEIKRDSSISKKALGERTAVTGQDGQLYQSQNDTLHGYYQLVWQVNVKETANDSLPVKQQSGIFYDLLPSHSDIVEGSVNVYLDANGDVNENTPSLSPASFEVLPRIDNYHDSGKKLFTLKINAPCDASYTVTYATIHAHDDLQDYGDIALNTVAYQTGNDSIGKGYPDNGGNYAVSMSDYIKGLDPENGGAKRFIYAESTEDILALFPTSSGIYKKVASASYPTFSRTATVHNGENYYYSIRMKNDSVTSALDIAILDSLENYRTVGSTQYNSGLDHDRDWHGQIVSFDLSGVAAKLAAYGGSQSQFSVSSDDLELILYEGNDENDIVNLEDNELYSDSDNRQTLLKYLLDPSKLTSAERSSFQTRFGEYAKKWKVVKDWRDLTTDVNNHPIDLTRVSAFIVYTGEDFKLGKGDSLSFVVNMKAPDNLPETGATADPASGHYLVPPSTYNNVYRSFTTTRASTQGDEERTYFYTHYDYTTLRISTVGTVRFAKRDSVTGEGIPGITFSLTGISDYGTAYDETLVSDSSGYVVFQNLERGTYTMIESDAGEDHLIDTEPKIVRVDPLGEVTIVTIDGEELKSEDGTEYELKNLPRYHGDLTFRKTDSLTGKGIAGAVFMLSGTSDYNTVYDENLKAESSTDGTVTFHNIEKGSYTLKEIVTPDDYTPPVNNEYRVTSRGTSNLVFSVTGENTGSVNGMLVIRNTPAAVMKVQKADTITSAMLSDAKFTLTASEELNSRISSMNDRLQEQYAAQGLEEDEIRERIGWTYDTAADQWKQTLEGSNTSEAGGYRFIRLLPGTYTLTETDAPAHYSKPEGVGDYMVTVREDLVITLDTTSERKGFSYIMLDSNQNPVVTDAEHAAYYRIENDASYEDAKTVIKSWLGGTGEDGKFPVFHLSTERPEESIRKVTIDKATLHSLLSGETEFVRSTTLDAGATNAKDTSFTDEAGNFKIWRNGTKVYWWSDADIIYLPPDCKELFSGYNGANLDLTEFYVDKVTTFESAFAGCTNLATIKFNNDEGTNFANGQKITSMKEMFSGCTLLKKVDLSRLETTDTLKNTSYMFYNCKDIASIDITGLNTSGVTDMSYMFGSDDNNKKEKLTILDTSHITAGSALETVEGMFKNCQKITKLDLRKFGNCTSLTNINSWFNNCWWMESIDLSNFTTTQLKDVRFLFTNLGNHQAGGTAINDTHCIIFAKGKWECDSTVQTNNEMDDCFRIKLYDHRFKNSTKDTKVGYVQGSIEHLNVVLYSDYSTGISNGGSYGTFIINGSNVNNNTSRLFGGYFSDAASQYYKDWAAAEYGTTTPDDPAPGTEPDPGSDPDPGSGSGSYAPASYPGFSPDGDPAEEEIDTSGYTANELNALEQSLGKKLFTFEYVTAETGTAVDGKANTFTVAETLYLTATYKEKRDDGKYYTVSQQYKYDTPLTATWSSVTRDGSAAQWYCDMTVHSADDEFFAWEDPVAGYQSTADNSAERPPILTASRTDKPVITNASIVGEPVKIGSLELRKTLTGGNKFTQESFWFKVTMWQDGSPYSFAPFDENGVAWFEVAPNAAEPVRITGIPEDCTYTVEETSDEDHPMPPGYTVQSTAQSGTIVADTAAEATLTNAMNTCSLTVGKTAVLEKTVDGVPLDPIPEDDPDLLAWQAETFPFTVYFTNLVKGKEYTYTVDGTAKTFTADTAGTVVPFSLKHGQTAVFSEIPYGTGYQVTEGAIEDTCTVQCNDQDANSTGSKTLTENAVEAFTNTKSVNAVTPPETVSVKVVKQWQTEDGTTVEWDTNAGTPLNADESYPSFLKVYLGRALKVPAGDGKYLYLDQEATYTSYSLKAKEAWTYTFDDLPKYGQYTQGGDPYPYVYFVTEVVPFGFSNQNEESDKMEGSDSIVAKSPENAADSDLLECTLKNQKEATYTLSLVKLVTGNMANKAQDFTFEITFTNLDGSPLTGTGLTLSVRDLFDTNYSRDRTYTLEGKGKAVISLPHGRIIRFSNIPKTVGYTIKELDSEKNGYTVMTGEYDEYSATDPTAAQTAAAALTDANINAEATVTGAYDENKPDRNYVFLNKRNVVIPTGVQQSDAVPLVTITAILGIMAVCFIRRRKRT